MTTGKSDLSDEIKWEFFQIVAMWVLLYGCTTWTLMKCQEKKVRWELLKDSACYFEQILEAALHKATALWPLTFHHTNHPRKVRKTCWALLEKKEQTQKWYSMDFYLWTHQCWPTNKNLHSSGLCRYWMPPRGLAKNYGQ